MGDTNKVKALQEGKNAFLSGEPETAARYFRAAATADPRNPDAWRFLGFALNAGQNPAEAVPAFERATRLDEKDAEAPFGLALALVALGDRARALQAFETVHRLRPDHPALLAPFLQTLLAHARHQIDTANVEWAKRHIERALEIAPRNPEALVLLIEYACKIDDHNLAVRTITELEKVKPDYPGLPQMKQDFGLLKEKERGWLY